MAEVQIDKNVYFRMDKSYTNDEGEEVFGVWELGWRDPNTHVIHFEDSSEVQAVVEPQQVEDHGQVTVEVPDEPAFAQEPEGSEE